MLVEEEVFRLPEVAELPAVLGGNDEGGAAPEVVIIDERSSRIVGSTLIGSLRW